jgi:pimeloyl-ACP methyl ester carboxylesterase
VSLAQDAHDLIEALDLSEPVIGGWSLGGLAAQAVVAKYPQYVSHAVLIATGPPGPLVKTAEQLFYDIARMPKNTLEEEIILFFEPRSQVSREAARRYHATGRRIRSLPITIDQLL